MSDDAHILVVDDDLEIREPLRQYLRAHGFRVSIAANGEEADQVLRSSSIDLVVLDIMMPGESGLDVVKRLTASDDIPVILLSALAEETDRIVGIELGADDYVCKPFNPRELIARIRTVLRRADSLPRQGRQSDGVVRFDRWQFDLAKPEIRSRDGDVQELTSAEWTLLSVFVRHPGITLARDQLLDLTKGKESRVFDRSIDNQVSRLRRKIEQIPGEPQIIITKWGGGYVFVAPLEWDTL